MKNSSTRNRGFTLVEALAALAVMSIVIFMALTYRSVTTNNTNLERYVGTKNRVLATIRESAALPATLRASMLASVNGVYVNPALVACAGGDPPGSCTSGQKVPFTMFSPIMGRDASGNILGVQAVSAPEGSLTNLVRVDSFGATCTTPSPDCSLLIFTSMIAQCGPATVPSPTPAPNAAELKPQATCTFADVIQVNYTVQVDSSVASSAMSSMMESASGSVTVPVLYISGNLPK